MILKFMVIVLISASAVYAQHKCCNGPENIIGIGKCKDGSNITGISCKRKYVLRPEENASFNINSNLTLVDDGILISTDSYCLTKDFETEEKIALVCFPEQSAKYEEDQMYVFRAACSVISVLFLTATVVVYILVPTLRDLQGKCLLHSIVALALALLLLCIMQFGLYIPEHVCEGVGYVTLALFLATFTWLNIISFHIWRTTIIPNALGTNKQWYLIYCIYGYGVPLILVLSAIIGHHAPGEHIKPGIGFNSCWFSNRAAEWAYFYGPISFLLTANIIFFCWTLKKLWRDIRSNDINSPKIRSSRYKCLLYIKLFFIMGLSWIFEVLSFAFDDADNFMHYVWMITDFVNALQGVLIFLILVAFRKRALRGLAKQNFGCIHLPPQWKTLQDEEVDELVEEEKLTQGNGSEERFQKPKDNVV